MFFFPHFYLLLLNDLIGPADSGGDDGAIAACTLEELVKEKQLSDALFVDYVVLNIDFAMPRRR